MAPKWETSKIKGSFICLQVTLDWKLPWTAGFLGLQVTLACRLPWTAGYRTLGCLAASLASCGNVLRASSSSARHRLSRFVSGVLRTRKPLSNTDNQCWSSGSAFFGRSGPDPSLFSERCWVDWNDACKIKFWQKIKFLRLKKKIKIK